MFASAEVTAGDDVDGLNLHHAVFISERGHRHFMQPCPAHVDRCCTIYESRPTTCRGFECELLSRVRSGELNVEDATTTIDRTLELRDRAHRGYAAIRVPPAAPAGGTPVRLTRPSFIEMSNDADHHLEVAADPDAFRQRHLDFFDSAHSLKIALRDHFGLGLDSTAKANR